MSTKIPITIEGNLTKDPEFGEAESGTKFARFTVAVTDRQLDETTKQWKDGATKFHNTTVFGQQAEHVRDSLQKGDTVLVNGNLEFRHWVDKETQQEREGTQIVADVVAPSLRYRTATVNRPASAPKVDGPEASATGPVVVPHDATREASISR